MSRRIEQVVVSVATTGSAGSAAADQRTPSMEGELLDIFLDWSGSAPATSDITISYVDPSRGNLFATTNTVTDVLVAPRVKPVDNANAAITNAHDRFALNGPLRIVIAQCDQLAAAVVVYFRYLAAE